MVPTQHRLYKQIKPLLIPSLYRIIKITYLTQQFKERNRQRQVHQSAILQNFGQEDSKGPEEAGHSVDKTGVLWEGSWEQSLRPVDVVTGHLLAASLVPDIYIYSFLFVCIIQCKAAAKVNLGSSVCLKIPFKMCLITDNA